MGLLCRMHVCQRVAYAHFAMQIVIVMSPQTQTFRGQISFVFLSYYCQHCAFYRVYIPRVSKWEERGRKEVGSRKMHLALDVHDIENCKFLEAEYCLIHLCIIRTRASKNVV
jgi:hypothetical protein